MHCSKTSLRLHGEGRWCYLWKPAAAESLRRPLGGTADIMRDGVAQKVASPCVRNSLRKKSKDYLTLSIYWSGHCSMIRLTHLVAAQHRSIALRGWKTRLLRPRAQVTPDDQEATHSSDARS